MSQAVAGNGTLEGLVIALVVAIEICEASASLFDYDLGCRSIPWRCS